MGLSGLAAGAGGVAALYGYEGVQKVEAADPGVRVAHAVHDAAMRGRVPAGRCRELNFAVYVAGEAHGNRAAGDCRVCKERAAKIVRQQIGGGKASNLFNAITSMLEEMIC